MNSFTSRARVQSDRARRMAPALAVLVAVTGLSCAGLPAAGGAAAAAKVSPPVALLATTASLNLQRDKGQAITLYGLGFYLQAPQNKVTFKVERPAYDVPVQATMTVGAGPRAVVRPIPASAFTRDGAVDVSIMPNVYTYSVESSAGKLVKTGKLDFCPDSSLAAPSVRNASVRSRFPDECFGGSPFQVGNVFGIQRGWAVPVLANFYGDVPSFNGADGTYTLTVKINKTWQTLFGMSDAQSQKSVKLKVKTVAGSGDEEDRAATTSKAANARATGASSVAGERAAGDNAAAAAMASTEQTAGTASTGELAAAHPARRPMPDLRALPADQIRLAPETVTVKKKKVSKTYLDFNATVWNGGTSPLVVDGFRRPGSTLMDAYEYFYDKTGKETGSTSVGTLKWDGSKGQNHWRYSAFAASSLLTSTKKPTMNSSKEAFCLAPTDAIDLSLPNANLDPRSNDLDTACDPGDPAALSIHDVLDDGWGDTYGQDLPGQSFDVTKVPNGIYYIDVLANPDHKLAELDSTNNRTDRKIKIGGKVGGKRTLKVYPYQTIAG